MIAPQTTLGRQLVAFLREYPGTGTDMLEHEFGTPAALMRATIDELVERRLITQITGFGYYSTGFWDADEDEIKRPAPL